MVGIQNSWDQTISVSGKDDYRLCTWSPCGRFVAALIKNTIDIRNQLTFELITTLQPTETTPIITGPLTYSPDGCSLACASDTAIIIWDIQTGGVAKEILHGGTQTTSLVWSLDGRTIGTVEYLSPDTGNMGTYVYAYDVALGTPVFFETIHSSDKPHLWVYNESFRVMTTERNHLNQAMIQIQIKGFQPAQSHLFTIHMMNITPVTRTEDTSTDHPPGSEVISFSPTTGRVSVSAGNKLLIFHHWFPDPVLREEGPFLSHCFSSDGRLFAGSKEDSIHIWEYATAGYTHLTKIRCQDWPNSLQFSPIPSSILCHSGNILQRSHLGNLLTVSQPPRRQYAALSHSGSRIATAYGPESVVTIVDPHSQSPSQLIETGVWIEGLILTGNVLLVVGSGLVVAWLLTEEGLVGGVFDGRIPNRSDCIWIVPLPFFRYELEFKVEGESGVIEYDRSAFLYHTATGEVIKPDQAPLRLSSPGYNPRGGFCGRHYLRFHDLLQDDTLPEGSWYPSETTLREGWIKDPEGKHRLWLQVEWRKSWDLADWRPDATTQFSTIDDQPLIIKF